MGQSQSLSRESHSGAVSLNIPRSTSTARRSPASSPANRTAPGAAAETGPFWITDDPTFRARVLTEYYDVAAAAQLGVGHFGVVRLGERLADRAKVAIKTVPKKRQAYVDMLWNEITILR